MEHAHSQLIALPIVPIYVAEEIEGAKQYYIYKERCVFCDIARQETEAGVYRWREITEGHLALIELDALQPKPMTLHRLLLLRTS